MLIAVGVNASLRPKPADATAFHTAAQKAIYSFPYTIGDWVGRDQEIPASAIKLLQPNAILSRHYVNNKSGESASLLIVQTRNARDMVGHYPPICYPANGYTQTKAMPIDWNASGLNMIGTDYTFSIQRQNSTPQLNVANFIILPNGKVVPDMDALNRAAADYTRFFQGAAQLQLVTNQNYSDEQRERIFNELIGQNISIIQTLLSGDKYIVQADQNIVDQPRNIK
ncbi:exosortase-associated EpsI family protein [Planctomycetota bacterium]|nr:exosortase-associated EpsI family protein [Planctomycetota bacterium]